MTPGEPHAENCRHESGATRREFLLATARRAAGAACIPSIALVSGCARGRSPQAADAGPIAEYELEIARHEATPDGRQRGVMSFNGRLPGPLIRAKLGQTLRVHVHNKLDVPSSVHWHGMHQTGTWQMDGVENVSAPPIPAGESFVYRFVAAPAGTHWYHSHVGVQYGDGLFGPLIVDEETPPAEYGREAILLINDWFLKSAEEILAGLVGSAGPEMKMPMQPAGEPTGDPAAGEEPSAPNADKKKMAGDKMAPMPGMGAGPDVGDVPFESFLFNGQGRFDPAANAPLTALEVAPGEKVRLRLINGSSTYAYRFQIDGHRLTVIASDGAPIAPVEVDNLQINVGERYDVLLTAGGSGNVWMRAVTLAGGEGRAILRYRGAPLDEPADSPVVWGADALAPAAVRFPAPVELLPDPREIRWLLGGSMQPYRWTINGQQYPDAEPVPLTPGENVRFIIENPTGMDHPFHLHGHYFHVLGPPDELNLIDPPQKDTVNVPARSTLVLQWRAINSGRWFFHCHIEWHLATGMARVIEIG